MSDILSQQDISEIRNWQEKIAIANQNNIFCHCRTCSYEWVDSTFEAVCPNCGSKKVERISCWQFPDD
jgi:rubrerythrin